MITNTQPATGVVTITPSDATAIGPLGVVRQIYVGTGGDIAVAMQDKSSATFKSVPQGSFITGFITHVKATGTTASNLIGML